MLKPVGLIILDGWGLAPAGPGNPISMANIPNFNRFWSLYPHAKLTASGEAVGLPRGEDGNTETGHLNLGAGSIIYQDLPRINLAIADGTFFENKAFLGAAGHVRKNRSKLHLLGLIGTGGVHSNTEHLYALLHFCKEQAVNNVNLHLFTDGRDSPPSSALEYIKLINEEISRLGVGRIASVMGRYYAMDRDRRWERTEKAYLALTKGEANKALTAEEAIKTAYERKETDEFIYPTVITMDNKPTAQVEDNDAVIFFNFRVDRPRQLTEAFVIDEFAKVGTAQSFDPYAVKYYKRHDVGEDQLANPVFKRERRINNLFFVTMTQYENNLPAIPAFPPQQVDYPLSRVISEHNLRQLHVSETEKERFVTYYFNGLRETAFPLEEHLIVPSPKVSTYDLEPGMSALTMTQELIKKISQGVFSFFVVNYANPDMVGHTGVIPAAVKALEVTDECLGNLVRCVLTFSGSCIITADHGNVEEMIDPKTGGIDTEHSTNPVPFIVISREFEGRSTEMESGILADVAPSILALMDLPKPSTMTGRNIITVKI